MSDRLLQFGFVLVLLGLLTGLAVPKFANPRMGLANHMVGLVNGLLLVAFGLVWPRLDLGHGWLLAAFWLALFSAYANWLATLLAAIWNNGGALMPIGAAGRTGTPLQERIVGGLLISLSLAVIAATVLVIIGLS